MDDTGVIVIHLLIRVVFGVACAAIAQNRGRSGVAWFFIGALFACIGLLVLLVIPNLKIEQERHDRLRRENRRLRERTEAAIKQVEQLIARLT